MTMTTEQLQDKTVEELRAMATKQEIEGRAGMNKDELVAALSDDSGPTKEEKQAKASKTTTTDNPPVHPLHGIHIKGTAIQGKGETRLFQTSHDTKEWLTKQQAKDKGFYWADEPTA